MNINKIITIIQNGSTKKVLVEMVKMTRNVPSGPSIFIVFCIEGLVIRQGEQQKPTGFEKPLEHGHLGMKVIYMLKNMP